METRETSTGPGVSTEPRALPRLGRAATWPILAIVYGLVLWGIVIGLVMLVGRWVLPGTQASSLIPALVAVEIVTALVVAGVTIDFLRRCRADTTADGVRFGAWATIVGMTADGILLVATDFDLPGLSEDKTLTLIAALFFGYPVTLLVTWMVAGFRLRGRRA